MKLWIKALLFYATFMAGPFLMPKIAVLAGIASGQGKAGLGIGWFFFFGITQFLRPSVERPEFSHKTASTPIHAAQINPRCHPASLRGSSAGAISRSSL